MTDDESAAAEPHATAPIDNGAHVVIKILATHMMCGAVLGRAGASIAEIQTGSGCKLQISGSGDFYPGTHDRVMYINGEMLKARYACTLEYAPFAMQAMSALHMVLQKLRTESVFRDEIEAGYMQADQVQLRMIMLGRLCGAIIGQGGESIKEIMAATSTEIRVQPRDECMPGSQERIITMVGSENLVLQAVGRILRKVLAEPLFAEYQQQSMPGSSGGASLGGNGGGAMQRARVAADEPIAHVPCHFELSLNQAQAGAVLGMKGANIISINKLSGAKVHIQSRDEVEAGELRVCTISGTLDAVSAAYDLVVAKLRNANRERAPRGPPRGQAAQ